MHHGILQILSPCLWALLAGLLIARTCAAGELDVNFRAGDFGVLERFLGPNDNPRDQRPEYIVLVEDGRAVHIAPAAAPAHRDFKRSLEACGKPD
jgi:hypothetical protein